MDENRKRALELIEKWIKEEEEREEALRKESNEDGANTTADNNKE